MDRPLPLGTVLPLDEVTGALEALRRVLESEDDFELVLRQVCRQVVRAVPDIDEASITLLQHGKPHTAVATSDIVAELDHDQYRLADGPCLEAGRTGKVVRVAVRETAERWPQFALSARQAGFGSFLAVPLEVHDGLSGAVNCYGGHNDGFAEVDAQVLELYTTAVEAVLRTFARYLEARESTEQLRTALTSRAVIDQAKGVLMAVRQIDADEAFAILVTQSQRENVKLRQVAERFIANVTGKPWPGRTERGAR